MNTVRASVSSVRPLSDTYWFAAPLLKCSMEMLRNGLQAGLMKLFLIGCQETQSTFSFFGLTFLSLFSELTYFSVEEGKILNVMRFFTKFDESPP